MLLRHKTTNAACAAWATPGQCLRGQLIEIEGRFVHALLRFPAVGAMAELA